MANIVTPISTQSLPKSVDPAVRKHFVDTLDEVQPKMSNVFKEAEQIDWNEQHQGYTGIGQLPTVAQGAAYTADSPIQRYGTTYTPTKYGDYIQLTDEESRFDKTGVIGRGKGLAKMQAEAIARTMETAGSNVWLRGFNTSYTSYGDSKPLFSISHTRADGGTALSNASSSSIPFSDTNLETGLLAANLVLDDRGQPKEVYCSTLLIPPALERTASIVTKSQLRSGTADNDVNVYGMREHEGTLYVDKFIMWKYLSTTFNSNGSNTAWYLIDPRQFAVNWLWGVHPEIGEMNTQAGYLNDTYLWKCRVEFSTGWDDWRATWASKGDSSTYSS